MLKITLRIIGVIFLIGWGFLPIFSGNAAPVHSSSRETILKGHPPVVLESVVAATKPEQAISALQKIIQETPPLARGSQPLAGKLFAVHQESLRRLQNLPSASLPDWSLAEGDLWLRLWERISYEEGRFQSLMDVIILREGLWKAIGAKMAELQVLQPGSEGQFRSLLRWMEDRKPVYPVDRIFLLEAKARWPQSQMKSAEKVAQMLQKRPEIPISAAVRTIKLRSSNEISALEREWSETQISRMKEETENYEKLLLRSALRIYELKSGGKASQSLAELEKEGFLSRIPIRAATGKPWNLADLSL